MGNVCKENTKVDKHEDFNNSWNGNQHKNNFEAKDNVFSSQRNVTNQNNGNLFQGGSRETFEFNREEDGKNFYNEGTYNPPKNINNDDHRLTFAHQNNQRNQIFGDVDNFQPKEKLVSSHLFIKDENEFNINNEENKTQNDYNHLKKSNFQEYFSGVNNQSKEDVQKNNMMYTSSKIQPENLSKNILKNSNINVALNKNTKNYRGGIRESNFDNLPDYNENNNYKSSQFGKDIEKTKEKENKNFVVLANGANYTGNLKYGLPDGFGKETFKNGDFYEGNYVYGKREGNGTFEKLNKYVYIGGFENGLYKGNGKIIYKNGDVFEGNFNDNLQDGKGILKNNNGNILKDGEWIKGTFVN